MLNFHVTPEELKVFGGWEFWPTSDPKRSGLILDAEPAVWAKQEGDRVYLFLQAAELQTFNDLAKLGDQPSRRERVGPVVVMWDQVTENSLQGPLDPEIEYELGQIYGSLFPEDVGQGESNFGIWLWPGPPLGDFGTSNAADIECSWRIRAEGFNVYLGARLA